MRSASEVAAAWVDRERPDLICRVGETEDGAIARAKDAYVRGALTLSEFEHRVATILRCTGGRGGVIERLTRC